MKKALFLDLAILAVIAAAILDCSAHRKLQAANILKKCSFSFQKAELNSVSLDSLKFSIFLESKNGSNDSLFIQTMEGFVYLDSLLEVPMSLSKSVWISPGYGSVQFFGAAKINLSLLSAVKAKKFRIAGKAYIALAPNQSTTEVDFDETKDIPPDMAEKFVQRILLQFIK